MVRGVDSGNGRREEARKRKRDARKERRVSSRASLTGAPLFPAAANLTKDGGEHTDDLGTARDSFTGSLPEIFARLASGEASQAGGSVGQAAGDLIPVQSHLSGHERAAALLHGSDSEEDGGEAEAEEYADAFLRSIFVQQPERPPPGPQGDTGVADSQGGVQGRGGAPEEGREEELIGPLPPTSAPSDWKMAPMDPEGAEDADEGEYEWVEASNSRELAVTGLKEREPEGRKRKRGASDKEKIRVLEKRAKKAKRMTAGDAMASAMASIRRKEKALRKVTAGAEGIFSIDVAGDRDNLVYEELYRMAVPLYRRMPGRCLGLPAGHRLRYLRQHRAYLLSSATQETRKSITRYYDASQLWRWADAEAAAIQVGSLPASGAADPILRGESFVSFAEAAGSVPVPAGQPPAPPLAGGEEAGNEETEETHEAYLMRRARQLNIETQLRPSKEHVWLDLIAFQEEYDGRGVRSVSAAIRGKQLAIYAVALQHLPDSEALLMGYLACAGELWPYQRLLALWQQVVRKKGANGRLWAHYLAFCSSSLTHFSIDLCRKAHAEAMVAMYREKRRLVHVGDHRGAEKAEMRVTEFFRQLCAFEHLTGHVERAMGLFQAQVEFACFYPGLLTDYNQRLLSFGPFWESEEPRIGEMRTKTWAGPLPPGSYPPHSLSPPPPDERSAGEWAEEEMWQQRVRWLPRRSSDMDVSEAGEEDEDVDSVLLFSDVDEILLELRSEAARVHLILSFADFVISTGQGTVTGAVQLAAEIPGTDSEEMQQRERTAESVSRLAGKWLDRRQGAPNILEEGLLVEEDEGSEMLDGARQAFVRNLLQEATLQYPGAYALVEARVAFEAQYCTKAGDRTSLKRFRAVCKQQLQAHMGGDSASLALWHAYAAAEFALGATSEALRICDIALSMAQRREVPDVGQLLLSRLYAEVELSVVLATHKSLLADLRRQEKMQVDQGASVALCRGLSLAKIKQMTLASFLLVSSRALHVLTCVMEESFVSIYVKPPKKSKKAPSAPLPPPTPLSVSGTRVLRARNRFAALIEDLDRVPCTAAYRRELLSCFSWFEFVTKGREAGAQVLEKRAEAAGGVDDAEALYECLMRQTELHSAMYLTQAETVRVLATRVLWRFPANCHALNLLLSHQSHAALDGRDRRIIDHICSKRGCTTPVPWLFAIAAELARNPASGRAERTFERALAQPMLRQSVLLWRSYLQLLLERGRQADARKVFFRAVRYCPASKALWLYSSRLGLSEEETLQVVELMEDKELRMRSTHPLILRLQE